MIFIDTETTGLLQPEANDLRVQPHITEIYAVKLNLSKDGFEFVEDFESLFHIPVPLPEFITKITGITDEMLLGQPSFAAKYIELCHFFIGEDTIVGHNLAFDAGMLWVELARIQCETKFPWPFIQKCTVELSLGIKNHRLKLSDLHELATGEPHGNAHRARGDVEAMVRCYEWMINQGHIL